LYSKEKQEFLLISCFVVGAAALKQGAATFMLSLMAEM